MPDIPEAAVQAVAEKMLRRYESQYDASHLTWRDFADDARSDLGAAAPILAEAVARRILEHRETIADPADIRAHEDGARRARAARAHFRTAAQIAALAFFADEDKKRMAAGALARGEFIACNPEVPDA